jgi:uncharacterized protein (TIGR03437 family)
MTLQRAVLYSLALLLINASLGFGQPTIKLIAGGNGLAPIGDGGPAVSAFIGQAGNITLDLAGNLYIWDATDSRIRKVNTAGIISSVTATIGQLKEIEGTGGLATDSAGNLYIGDRQSYVVRKVDTSGVMTTIAGNGTFGLSGGDGSQATSVSICSPSGVAVDRAGNVYFGSSICGAVRKVDTSGVLSTYAGGNTFDGSLGAPWAIALDNSGNLYVCDDAVGTRVYKVTPGGAITVIAGNGTSGFSGDGGPATSAQLFEAHGVAVDAAGNVYIADTSNLRVRRVDTNGIITTVAGGPNSAPNEVDGGPPTGVNVGALDVAVDSAGNLYIYGGNRVYKVTGLSSGTTPPPAPAISSNGVVNGASFQPGVTANAWVTIQGTNLAGQTDDWSNSIVNGALPTMLDGVSVSMGGQAAYVYYISPGQLNVLAPDVPAGPVTVTVTAPGGTSASFTATADAYGPAFFPWPGNQVVATRTDYSYAVKAGTFAGATTIPAKPGDVIILWATGLGPTNPAAPLGVATPGTGSYPTASLPTVTVNNTPAMVYGAALAPGSAGLYQIAIQVPPSLADGDWPIQAMIGGILSPAGTILSVHQ